MLFETIFLTFCHLTLIASGHPLEEKREVRFHKHEKATGAFAARPDSNRNIILERLQHQDKGFLPLFNVHYLICFYAAKGKWPFIPGALQVQVNEVGRTFFKKSDIFIQTFCHKWFPVNKCYRPTYFVPVTPEPLRETSTICSCAAFKKLQQSKQPVLDANQASNISSETLQNTIEFLQGFLPGSTDEAPPSVHIGKKKKKTTITIDLGREDFKLT